MQPRSDMSLLRGLAVVLVSASTSLFLGCASSDGNASPEPSADAASDTRDSQSNDGGQPGTAHDGGPNDAASPRDAQPDAPFSMKTWKPPAKGLWIWYFDYIGMTAADAAAKAKADGVGYVVIKSGQDGSFWTTRYTASAVHEFTSRGMRVLAWPYITPAGGTPAIDAAVAAAKVPGTDGLVLDVEVEWEQGGDHSAEVKTLCEGIRAKVPGVWLGYTSFGWVGFHSGFPFRAFDTYCGDSAWPQVYYSDRGVSWDGASGLSQAKSMYKAAGLTAPFWPIQSNDDVYNTTSSPTSAELNGFFDQAGAYSSLWEFPAAGLTGKLTQLNGLHWNNP